ncbi:hypothetical protein like AT1G67420 [Hibiscus trionum]|uniref:Peptidase M28 domain-containing protein n=1 Tax=Hibiscus trionum TaxID=183268 RepID=A0A9W7LNB7_HIBTR|nr:hypothetical protein like AT1G67420 [Hibiscus trionum]
MALRFDARDVSGFKLLFSLAIVYGLMSFVVHSVIYTKFIKPLGIDVPLDRFSEARAIEHVRVLSLEIGNRQEGRVGLREAAEYIKAQLERVKERAGSNIRIEIEENVVSGTFNMMFLGHSMSFSYRNLTNILMRISSINSKHSDPSVLVNAHFDATLGSPGAADCGSCVASSLEIARLTIDSGWVPPRPIILLFNGAEESFLLGANGFMRTHEWRDSIGAFINLEATGTGGLDVVCQSGPSSWPSFVYAQSAIYPMANSAAQDIFPLIPADTDYRMFSRDYGSIPGLDIIFLFGGYYYHTSSDTVDRLLPGSIQARGDNLYSTIKAFSESSKLKNAHERESLGENDDYNDEQAVFFDYLTWFMIFYSRRTALVLHSVPIAIFLIMPFFLRWMNSGLCCCFATFYDFFKGVILHAIAIMLAIIFPVIFSILRLLFSSYGMNWFANPYLAFMMFTPISLIGLLIPRTLCHALPLSQDVSVLKTTKEATSDEARFWGAFGFYASITLAYHVAGLTGGFLTFFTSTSMLVAWISFHLSVKFCSHQSVGSAIFYVMPLIPCLLHSVYFGGTLVQFFVEKMGMMGSLPPPYGYYIPDIVMAAIVGIATGWSVGPIISICGNWLARSSVLQFLLHLSVVAMALSSQFFPYSTDAPKRVILQHTFLTADANQVVDSSYDVAVIDSNSLLFLFKHAPEVAKELHIGPEFSFETANMSSQRTFTAIFPVNFLFSRSLKFPAKDGSRRVYLELSLGSLEEVWVAVLNITGPLSSWSFADNKITVPETTEGGPPSYICRLTGAGHENWTFWLEANSSGDLRVEVAVLDQILVDEIKKLKRLFPAWADVVAFSSFMSTYIF